MSKPWKIAFLVGFALAFIIFAYFLRAIFMPLLVAVLLAYVLNPILEALERRKVPRMASIAGIYVVLSIALAGVIFWGIPAGVRQGTQFVRETLTDEDAKIHKVILWGDKRIKDWMSADSWAEVVRNLRERIEGKEGQLAATGGKVVGAVVTVMTRSVGGFIEVFSFIALVPVYLFFLLKNMNPWWQRVTRCIPRSYRDPTLATLGKIHRANAAFFRGQVTISLIEGLIVFLALSVMGVKFSFLFGALYAVLSVVPFLGVVIGFAVTELFVLADTGGFTTTFFLVAGLFAAIQVLEGVLLQPMILGKETGLHPIAIILSLLICGQLFGFFGVLIAVPIVSIAKILFEDYVWPMFEEVADLEKTPPAQ